MVEAAALTSIAKSALQLFTSLAKDEVLLLWHSAEDLEKLRRTIEYISCSLQDAEKRKSKESLVQCWLSDLRKVMYDAEDLFDALAAQVLCKKTMSGNAFTKEVRLFFSGSNQLGFFVKTAHEVKSFRESLDEISKNMREFNFIEQPHPALDHARKKTNSCVNKRDVIGRDEDKVHIIDMLIPKDKGENSSGQTVSVVAIIGFGGLGKTTLAKFVYNDDIVKPCFDVRLWACINDLSNLKLVLIEIIASQEKEHYELGLEKLQLKLREIIGGKKFLIVLDDVWDENLGHWLDLKTILCCGKSGSKVLVTTRSTKVAECVNALKPYWNLGLLSEEKAWDLFVKRAFQGEEISKGSELEPIGKKILSKCGNVPLAIVSVAGLLSQKARDERTWTQFYNNELKKVFLSGDDNSVKQVLMISYNDLHPNLKLCFAACSLFPKDYRFNKEYLVRLWLSQGILKPSSEDNEESLEEVGGAYFLELVSRSFFEEVDDYGELFKGSYSGNNENRRTVKIHDLLHDMAIDVAKTENLFLDKVPENKGQLDGLRHISIAFDLKDSFDCCSLVSNPKRVRTLLFQHKQSLCLSFLKPLLERFIMLRTLNLSHLEIDGIPESIGGLIHLRYLDLSGNEKLKLIPNSICKLHHLMILVLKGCSLLEKFPEKIEQLVSLRQLFINGCYSMNSLPSGLKSLTSVVNLDRLIVHQHDGGLRYLKDLDNLAGVLQIELPQAGWLDAIEDARIANMARKKKLNEMVIEWKQRSISTAGGQRMAKDEAKAVLEALRPHEELEYLSIRNYSGETLSSWFCTLKYVKQLYLRECDNVEYLEDGIKGNLDLPSLRLLRIEVMRNLKGWRRQEMAQGTSRLHLSKVLSLAIHACPLLKGQMPLFEAIEYVSLWEVDAEVVSELLAPNCSSQSHSNSKLKDLLLRQIKGLTHLREGWIRHLTALQRLTIEDWEDLKWVSRRGLTHLTSLKSLSVRSGEIGDEDADEMGSEAGMPWKALQGLQDMSIVVEDGNLVEGLQYLTSLKYLRLDKWKDALTDGGEMKGVTRKRTPFTKEMKGVERPMLMPKPMEALKNLRELYMGFSNEKFDLPKSGIPDLPSLNYLTIADCNNLNLNWETLLGMKLDSLTFKGVKRVINIPKKDDTTTAAEQRSLLRRIAIFEGAGANWVDDIPWISLSSSLEDLILSGMGEREQLPNGIQHLTSLQYIRLERCEKLSSLAVLNPNLTSLTALTIFNCSAELKRRCERETGEDWPLIRHTTRTNITVAKSTNQVESANESRNEEGSRKKGGCTPCWSPSVKE